MCFQWCTCNASIMASVEKEVIRFLATISTEQQFIKSFPTLMLESPSWNLCPLFDLAVLLIFYEMLPHCSYNHSASHLYSSSSKQPYLAQNHWPNLSCRKLGCHDSWPVEFLWACSFCLKVFIALYNIHMIILCVTQYAVLLMQALLCLV